MPKRKRWTMRFYKALMMCEEFNTPIIHRESGIKITPQNLGFTFNLENGMPMVGWELDDSPQPFSFEALFLGADKVQTVDGRNGAIYSYEEIKGSDSIMTMMPVHTKVKVVITPI